MTVNHLVAGSSPARGAKFSGTNYSYPGLQLYSIIRLSHQRILNMPSEKHHYLLNKTVCVGLNLICEDECFYKFQIAGKITLVNESVILLLPFESDEHFGLPPAFDEFVPGVEGAKYQLTNGNVTEVVSPDFLLTLDIAFKSKNIDIKRLTRKGYELPES